MPYKNLVIIWLEKNGRYAARVLSDDAVTPPLGHLRFVNISGQELALKCTGQDQVLLAAGADAIVAPRNGGVGLGVKMARPIKGTVGWELALMNSIPVRPHERVTAFIADSTNIALSLEEEGQGDDYQPDPLALFLIRDRGARP